MARFLIQTIKGEIKHDFAFTLIQSHDYYQWLKDPFDYNLTDEELLPKHVPIGSVEFVCNYLKQYFDISKTKEYSR